ncbi:MAG: D-alanyl-D-alanine carboxypeptidase [Dehalococcoidia bacterium]|nr:MAG: D-alanyl-D-alanine carboxypeptidase [Dehalococcoidia bacterium]
MQRAENLDVTRTSPRRARAMLGLVRPSFRLLHRTALVLLVGVCLGLVTPLLSVEATGPDSNQSGIIAAARDPLPPGSTAVVQADGDCLRVRPDASLTGTPLACVPSGSTALVLPLTRDADGYRWQFVTASGVTGWVADAYLAPAGSTPTPTSPSPGSSVSTGSLGTAACVSAVAPIKPGLNTTLSPNGVNLALWGGGTMNALNTATEAQGCRITAIYANRPGGGGLVPYLIGVPDFVNAEWQSTFAGGRIPAGTALMLLCASTGTQATVDVPTTIQAAAAPTATQAPRKIGLKPAPQVTASSVAVIDGESGALLFDKNANTPRPPASLTKIATAILAVEGTEAAAGVTVDVDGPRMAATNGSSIMGLRPGECYSVRDLLYGLMLPSGNDAAVAIAKYEAGSELAFVKQMNTMVKRLGLNGTFFTDPHGLGSAQHKSTAYDLAMMARYGMTLPLFREVVGTPQRITAGSRGLALYNTNSLLQRYPGVDGVKTGFTEEAGRTMVVSAMRNGHRVFVALLDDPNREDSAVALLDWVFQNYQW